MYDKIRNSQNFTFTMEEKSDEIDYKVVMAQRGTDVCIDMFSSDEHTTTLVYQNEAYFIMHEKRKTDKKCQSADSVLPNHSRSLQIIQSRVREQKTNYSDGLQSGTQGIRKQFTYQELSEP